MVSPIPTPRSMITVSRVGDSIRVSRVTAHGDEVIETDMEARALAVLLWGKLSRGEIADIGTPLLPWDTIITGINGLTSAVAALTAETKNLQHSLATHRVAMEATRAATTPVKVRGQ